MKVIKRMRNQQEANIIVGFLNAHGINAELLDGAMNSVLPVMPGGVRIAVPEEQEDEALTLLNNANSGATAIDEEDAP